MKPTIGRIVLFVLTATVAAQINDQRTLSEGKLVGNTVQEGDVYPMMITRVWPGPGGEVHASSLVNGQLFLDGNDTFWVTSTQASEEPQPGWFTWPKPPVKTESDVKIEQLTKELENWKRTAGQHYSDSNFYRNLLDEIGGKFGDAARTDDEGVVQDSVMYLKLAALVEQAVTPSAAVLAPPDYVGPSVPAALGGADNGSVAAGSGDAPAPVANADGSTESAPEAPAEAKETATA